MGKIIQRVRDRQRAADNWRLANNPRTFRDSSGRVFEVSAGYEAFNEISKMYRRPPKAGPKIDLGKLAGTYGGYTAGDELKLEIEKARAEQAQRVERNVLILTLIALPILGGMIVHFLT